MDDLANRIIRGYELRERIGAGGFGAVYRAYQEVVGREVAIKIILPAYANNPDFIRRFEAEAQLVARLEHINIVPLYDYWREPGGAYLVMRWLHGGSLRALLRKGPLTPDRTAQVLDQITAALAAAHRRGVVHRDLKPDNILLDEDGNAYLADFGIAKGGSSDDLEGRESIIGSPAYLSPEQITGEPTTPRTDIYSLGITLYELLSGRLPFTETQTGELLRKHLNDPLPPLHTRTIELDGRMSAVIQKATAKNPTQRYQDAPSVAADFRRAIRFGDRVIASSPPSPTIAPPAATRPSAPTAPQPATPDERTITPADDQPVQVAPPNDRTITPADEQAALPDERTITPADDEAVLAAPDDRTFTPADGIAAPPTKEPQPTFIEVPSVEVDNPYKGLRAFQQADADDFFGRDSLVSELLARLKDTGKSSRFLAVVGPSGSGKSSVVRAGLLPALRRGALPGSRNWFIVEMIPGATPLNELATALLGVAVNPPANLLVQLREDENGLLHAVNSILPADDNSELVLVIDQLEEVFTLLDSESERAHLLNSLLAAVNDPSSRLRLIVTLRADFYDRPLLYPDFGNLVRMRTEVVLPLNASELRQAIVGPAERIGLTLEPGLVDAIVTDVGEQPGALPLLQYALTELFERRKGHVLTLSAYRESGGVFGALARRADELYVNLDGVGREAVRQVFLRLVMLGEGAEDTRRRVQLPELTSVSSGKQVIQDVIDTFGRYRLLTFDRDPLTRVPTVEVAHEALIRTWERLRGWLAESREDLRMQRRLAASVTEWLNSKRDHSFLASGTRLDQFGTWAAETTLALNADEQAYLDASVAERNTQRAEEEARQAKELALERRSRNRLRTLVVVLLVATVGALALSGVAVNQQQIAVANANTATNAQGQAINNANTATLAQGQAINNAKTAVSNAQTATNAQGQAINNAITATLAQGAALNNAKTAVSNAQTATNAQGQAINNAITATIAQGQAVNNQQTAVANALRSDAQRLAAESLNVAQSPDGNIELAGLLSVYAASHSYSAQTDAALVRATTLDYAEQAYPHGGRLTWVALSPDGKLALTAGDDGTVKLWDAQTGQAVRKIQTPAVSTLSYVWSATFSPDGRYIIAVSGGRNVEIYETATGKTVQTFKLDGEGSTGVMSPDGKSLLVAVGNYAVLIDVQSGAEIERFSGHTDSVLDAVMSADGKFVLTGSTDQSARLWDVATDKQIREFDDPTSPIKSVAFAPDGKTIATGGETTVIWDAQTGEKVLTLPGSPSVVAFSPDGKNIVATVGLHTVQMWSTADGTELARFSGHTDSISALAFSPDGQHLISGGWDGLARLWNVPQAGTPRRQFVGHTKAVTDLVVAPDGKTIITVSSDQTIRVWDTATDQEIREFPGVATICAALSPDGKTLLTGDADKIARLWDVATGKLLYQLVGHNGQIRGVAFTPDGKTAITSGFDDYTVRLWDVATGKQIRQLESNGSEVIGVAVSPDGKTILAGAFNGVALLWDAATGKIIRSLDTGEGQDSFVYSVAFSPDGTQAIVGGYDKTITLFDVQTGKKIRTYQGHSDIVSALAFSPDGKTILSGSADTTARLWDVATGQELRRLTGHTNVITAARFSPDGKTIYTASTDRTARQWDTDYHDSITWLCAQLPRDFTSTERAAYEIQDTSPTCPKSPAAQPTPAPTWTAVPVTQVAAISPILPPRVLSGHKSGTWAVAFSPDGKTLLTAGGDSTARLWDVATGQQIRTFSGHTDSIYAAAFSPDGTMIVTGSNDKTIQLWDVATGKELRRFAGNFGVPLAARFSPDGKTVLTGHGDFIARLWDVATGQQVQQFVGHLDQVKAVAFSPDGTTVATGSGDQTVRLWDTITGNQLKVLVDHEDAVLSVAFSPDGKYLLSGGGAFRAATGAGDTIVRLWDVATGQIVRRFVGHTAQVNSVAFSPDGTTILTAGNDAVARLWDVQTGRNLLRLPNESSEPNIILSAAFSPDGHTVAAGTFDGIARLWDISNAANSAPLVALLTPTPTLIPTAQGTSAAVALQPLTLTGNTTGVYSVAFSPDGKTLFTGSVDGTLRLWDALTGQQTHQYFGGSLVFSHDGRYFLVGSQTPQLHDARTGAGLIQYVGHTKPALAVAFSPDDKTIATGGYDNTIRLWDRDTAQQIRVFTGHTNAVWSLAFSPDGNTLVSTGLDSTLRLWNVQTGEQIREVTSIDGLGALFTADGKRLLFAGQTLQLVDAASGDVVQTFSGDPFGANNTITSMAFSPDEKLVVTTSTDKLIRLWDVQTGQQLRVIAGHTGIVWSAAFSPDGNYLLSGSDDKTAVLQPIQATAK